MFEEMLKTKFDEITFQFTGNLQHIFANWANDVSVASDYDFSNFIRECDKTIILH